MLRISLEDGKGVKIKDRPVRLKCLLRYADSNVPVTNQNVLRVWTDSQDGKATLKLNRGSLAIKARVEDVSKNHQIPFPSCVIAAPRDQSDSGRPTQARI